MFRIRALGWKVNTHRYAVTNESGSYAHKFYYNY